MIFDIGVYKVNNENDGVSSLTEIDFFMINLGYRLAILYNGFIYLAYSARYYSTNYIIDQFHDGV